MNYKYNVILLSSLWEEISKGVVHIKETKIHTMIGWKTALNIECDMNNKINEISIICDKIALGEFIIKTKLYEIQHWFIELLAKDNKNKALAVSHIKFLKME